MNIAQKMDLLLVVCETMRADGWVIAAGTSLDVEIMCCCPLGAVALAAGWFTRTESMSDPLDLSVQILDVSEGWARCFAHGFDGPAYAQEIEQNKNNVAYNYGRAFRGLYVTAGAV